MNGTLREVSVAINPATSREVYMKTPTPYPLATAQYFSVSTFASPSSLDGVSPDNCYVITKIPWFSKTAVLRDAENDFKNLELYVWDGQFFSGVESEALGSCVWRDIIAFDDADLNYYGSAEALKSRHVADVSKGMLALSGGPLVEECFDVDLWLYSYYGERPYVAYLSALSIEILETFRGMYMVHLDAICYERSIPLSLFHYMYQL